MRRPYRVEEGPDSPAWQQALAVLIVAVLSLVALFSQHPVERECLAYRSELAYVAALQRYAVIRVPCVEWGGWYSR